MSTQIMSGARAKIGFIDPATNQATFVGIFNNVSYGLTYDVQPAFTLGRFSAADTDYVGQELVNISASGYRVIDHGAHADLKLPTINQLLQSDYLTIVIVDRKDPTKNIAHFKKVRTTGYSTSISARNLEEISATFVAISVDDETSVLKGTNEEAGSATRLP